MELVMKFFDKENIIRNVGYRYETKGNKKNMEGLAAEVVDLAEDWAQNYTDYPEKKTRRELRRELRKHIKDNLDLEDHTKSYFIPSFVWIFLAQQLISWLIKILIEKYLQRLR
jgi:hypothetical protein|tara:strand:+ start:197 stop:535 length:339 start_codon:yes stop_codon:yes gene_type:complete